MTCHSYRQCNTAHKQYHAPELLSPSVVPVQGIVHESEAMTLCTVSMAGIPSVHIMLFKQLDLRRFVFYMSYMSCKLQELHMNTHGALAFHWRKVHKQVQVVVHVESDAYFHSHPVGSRLGTWASRQSTAWVNKLKWQSKVDENNLTMNMPLPEFWGGWWVVSNVSFKIEFWLGKPSCLHDQVRYLHAEGSPEDVPEWKIDRLAP
ncbi:hypothetical protein POSPLADRAFT_1048130 [Postia placenta MAD-698-R-SB12]|uniref:pyridoxal 5'-phosphate synthase n=1 Tax=Postia placenta MAD-698-R-SB12 TaxID=670580 RepID=A0A1X6MTI2_9APHY|nr:hypothetical protein POSPLADRAFT_1048130 [Postia placenta MAD-698-R-SB12]OSX59629.1 hypothetical protein POSPLADRAFT_1048130 [Postia placenta MAD-698-R-SB12]